MGSQPKKNRFDESILDTPKPITVVKFREIIEQEQEIRESCILEKYVESGWREYCAGLGVSDEEKRCYYRQFLLGRGELLTNPTPFTESSSEEARREYNADIEEAKQVAFLFLAAPLDGYDTERRLREILNFRELYPGASQCGGNVGYEVMVYNKNELLHQVTKFIEEHFRKGRIVILFVGHGDPDGQITLAGENCPLQEYVERVDEVAINLNPLVPIDLINAQCYAHLVPRAQSPSVNIIHLSNIENPETHSWCSYERVSGNVFCNWHIIELQNFAQTDRDKQPANGVTTQPTTRGFALALFPDTVDKRFKCETCKLVLRDAVQAPCGHRHCKTCLDDFIRSSSGRLCPACPEGAEGGEYQIFPDNGLKFEMHTLRIVCDQDGCGWTGCLHDYQESHEKSCRSKQSTIPDTEPRARSDRRMNEQTIYQKDVSRPPNVKKHLHVHECFRQREEIASSKRTIVSTSEGLDNKSGVLNWKITDFFRKRQNSHSGLLTRLDSPPFYTSPRGYKMCCRIFLDGSETGKGTHISIYFVLMPGKFDDQLSWPFDQSMSITLIDQKDRFPADITDIFIPDPTSSKRPISDMQVVAGDPQFMPHRLLYNHTEAAYVKDDAIILRATDSDASIEPFSPHGMKQLSSDLPRFPYTFAERFELETSKSVLRDAVQAPCGHRHCKTYLDDFIRSSDGRRCSACPEGAEGGESQIYPDNRVRIKVHSLKIVCDQDGCVWTGCLHDYQEYHEKSCRLR